MSNPSDNQMAQGKDFNATVPARFVRLPSIAEKKLGAAYVAPVRLDPRALEQMQQTIKSLSGEYAVKLATQIRELLHMIEDVCHLPGTSRSKFYDAIHDMRGLAGTFGHPIVGQTLVGHLVFDGVTHGFDMKTQDGGVEMQRVFHVAAKGIGKLADDRMSEGAGKTAHVMDGVVELATQVASMMTDVFNHVQQFADLVCEFDGIFARQRLDRLLHLFERTRVKTHRRDVGGA